MPPATSGLPAPLRVPVAALAAALLALILRLPARGLPIEGDAVAYGALARSLAHGEGFTIDRVPHDRYPPGWPTVLAVPIVLGATVTSAVRTTAWLLGGVAAALLVLVGARWTRGRVALPTLVALAAAHPILALYVGGLVPAAEALTLVLVLVAALLVGSTSRAGRIAALAVAGCLPLVRYDALPFALAVLVALWPRKATTPRPARARAVAAVVAFAPLAAWLVRTWIVSGTPFGTGYAHHDLSLARLPKNLLVFAGLLVPVSSLILLLPYGARGTLALWRGAADRAGVRPFLVAAAAHLAIVLLVAGPSGAGESALRFSSGSLRFGAVAWPFLFVAAAHALAAEKVAVARVVAGLTWTLCVALALHGVSGGLQRAVPVGPLAAARLHVLAEAYDAAVAEAGPADWIGLDLLPRGNDGVDVFLGDRAPGRRTGVLVRPRVGPRPGLFPRAGLLPLAEPFPAGAQVVLVTDVPRDGPVFTGERSDLGVGGVGIFHRALLRTIDGGAAGTLRVDAVRRPSAK